MRRPRRWPASRRSWARRGILRVGDEYVVRMPGPWDGPVRVVEVTPRSFRLVTLATHLEAGTIEFRAEPADGGLRFEIESWARSGDRLSNVLYDRLRMAKEIQLHMWTSFIERVARKSGGRLRGGIDIHTRRVEYGRVVIDRLIGHEREPRGVGRSARPPAELRPGTHRRVPPGQRLAPRRLPSAAAARGARRAAARRQLRGGQAADARLRVRRGVGRPGGLRARRRARGPRHAAARQHPRAALQLRGPRRRHRRSPRSGRRAAGARVGLELPHAGRPSRARADGLPGVEVAGQRRGRVPHRRRLQPRAGGQPAPAGSASCSSPAASSASSTATSATGWRGSSPRSWPRRADRRRASWHPPGP